MGLFAAKNAVLVAARLELGNTASRLLVHMALECWDETRGAQEPRRYFAGRESSAIALGFLAPANGSREAHRAVQRAVKELVDHGAIRRLNAPGYGHRAEYKLLLDSSRPIRREARSSDPSLLPFIGPEGTSNWYPQGASF